MDTAEIAGHVKVVELHVFLYWLLEYTPGYSTKLYKVPIPKMDPELEKENINIKLSKDSGESLIFDNISFPKRYTDVLDFYTYDLPDPIFFPSYWCHTLSPNGVVLKHLLAQSRGFEGCTSKLTIYPELMLTAELTDIKSIEFSTARNRWYRFTFVENSPFANLAVPSLHQKRIIKSEKHVDLSANCTTKNQGDLGTCGVTAVVNLLEFISERKLSTLFLYYNTRVHVDNERPHVDAGTDLASTIISLTENGICSENLWPYDATKFSTQPPEEAYSDAINLKLKLSEIQYLKNITEMKSVLLKGKPFMVDVAFCNDAYDAKTARTGKVPLPRENEEVDMELCEHSVFIVGYNDYNQEFIFQNSWGNTWGDNGLGYLPYYFMHNSLFRNAWTWNPVTNTRDNMT